MADLSEADFEDAEVWLFEAAFDMGAKLADPRGLRPRCKTICPQKAERLNAENSFFLPHLPLKFPLIAQMQILKLGFKRVLQGLSCLVFLLLQLPC